jgi:hypothetical protein
VYDQTSRFVLRLDAVPLLLWLLGTTAAEVRFVGWLDTRSVPWPGQPDRTCDTVAALRDRAAGDFPWAVVIEVQAEADPEMFGRLLQYLGAVWLGLRPAPLRGDRYGVGAVVINLTGKGQSGQAMRLGQTRVLTHLGVAEWNLAEMSAEELLAEVDGERAPTLALVRLPLMQKGGHPGIIREWLRLAAQETDKNKRKALGLAVLFAEKAGHGQAWREALKGWDVVESQIVKEWTAQARAEGEIKGAARALLRMLEGRFKALPDDLRTAIEAVADAGRLVDCIDHVQQSRTLHQFRQKAGL